MGMFTTMNEQQQQVEDKVYQLELNMNKRMDELLSKMNNQLGELRNVMKTPDNQILEKRGSG